MDRRTQAQINGDNAMAREMMRSDHFDALVELAKASHAMARGFNVTARQVFDRLAEDFDDQTFLERDLYGAEPLDGTPALHDEAFERGVKELERQNPHAEWRDPADKAVRSALTEPSPSP